jgi:hypothetical protein
MSTFNNVFSSYFQGSQRLVNSLIPANPNTNIPQVDNRMSLPYLAQVGAPPAVAPEPPTVVGVPTSRTIQVSFFVGGVTGDPPLTYSIAWGTALNKLPNNVPATQVVGQTNTYLATITGLQSSTEYFFASQVSNNNGSKRSVATPISTTAGGNVPPNQAPTVPVLLNGSVASDSFVVTFDVAGIVADPDPTYSILLAQAPNGVPFIPFPAELISGTSYRATAYNLVPNTGYIVVSVADNGVAPAQKSTVSAIITTDGGAPTQDLTTIAVAPFLIRGPRYQTSPGAVLDWYINCDAVGTNPAQPSLTQTYGSFYAATQTSDANVWPYQSGLVLADNNNQPNQQANPYITNLQSAGVKVCTSIGGFYADVLGMMGPYTPPVTVAPNPAAEDLANSIASIFLGVPGATNPLGWSKTNWSNISFDGINLDFENIGAGGNPGVSNTFPLPQSPLPSFPADLNTNIPNGGGSVPYSSYVASLKQLLVSLRAAAPTKLITIAPLSASAYVSGLTKNTAVNNALNTWAPFASQTVKPTTANFITPVATGANALLAPAQLALMDDVFVQFYNAPADIYLGGANFANLLAQWGFLALYTQKNVVGSRKVKINIGFAKGVITSPQNAVTAVIQDPYYYPQYQTSSPPNPNAVNPPGNTFPLIGAGIDAANLNNALNQANTLLQGSGLANAQSIQIEDWCSGAGFWAGGPATQAATEIYDFRSNGVPDLPQGGYTYCWSDAQYPAPDPFWAGHLPVVVIPPSGGDSVPRNAPDPTLSLWLPTSINLQYPRSATGTAPLTYSVLVSEQPDMTPATEVFETAVFPPGVGGVTIPNLTAGNDYYTQVKVTNALGYDVGQIAPFITPTGAGTPPIGNSTSVLVNNLTSTGCTITVDTTGVSADPAYRIFFQLNHTPTAGIQQIIVSAGLKSSNLWTATTNVLQPNTLYSVYVVAYNGSGPGQIVNIQKPRFTTLPA